MTLNPAHKPIKVALALLVVLIMLVQVPMVANLSVTPSGPVSIGTQGTGTQANSQAPYFGFKFPNSYQRPAVPSNIGAQGIQGPNVPSSLLGPQGTVGATGHIGPVNYTGQLPWYPANVVATITVNEGTQSTNSAASGVAVKLLNVTDGNSVTATTSSSGSASLTVPAGWYLVQISAGSGYISFSQMMNIASSMAFTRYLLPVSYGAATVSNGPQATNWATVYMEQPTSPFGTGSSAYMPQMEVQLLNASNGGSVLATAYTLSNGTAAFHNVNPSFSYSFRFHGYSNDLTGVIYSIANYTESFTVSNSNFVDNSPLNLGGRSSTTGSVTGTAPTQYSPNGYSWSLTQDTVVTGGTTYISQKLNLVGHSLKFINALVYFNESQSGTSGGNGLDLFFINSTVVVLTNLKGLFGDPNSLHQVATHIDHSAIYAAAKSVPLSGEAVSIITNNVTNSYLTGYLSLAGTFRNDEFNYVQSGPVLSVNNGFVESSTIEQSTMFGPAVSKLTVFSGDLVSDNSSTTMFSSNFGYYNDTNITYTIPASNTLVYFSRGTVFANNIYLSFATRPDLSASQYRASFGGSVDLIAGTVNISKSVLIFNQTPIYPWVDLFMGGSSIHFYDDYINENYTISQIVNKWDYHIINIDVGNEFVYVNYTTIVTGGLFNIVGNNMTLSHDYFTGFNEIDADTFQNQLFVSMNSRGPFSVTYSNDTWGYVYVNYSLTSLITPHTYNGPGQFIEDMNVHAPPAYAGPAYLNITHITFLPFFGGNSTRYSNTAPVEILLGEGGPGNVITNISYNLFKNSYNYTTGPDRYNVTPYYWDIVIFGGSGKIYDNYFLNLNEKVIPIGGNNNESGVQGWAGKYALIDNHFFFTPAHNESHVPIFSNLNIEATNTNTVSAMSYQIPVFYNSTLTKVSGGTYVFNTSHFTTNIAIYSGKGVWVWNISPDVSIQSGKPDVSYESGLVGGIQPNFTWNGTSYQLAVEKNMTYISAGSSSASSIGLQFRVPIGLGQLDVWMYNPGSGKNQLMKSVPESGSLSSVAVTYDPASAPLGAVFFTNTTSIYSITFKENGLSKGTNWTVSVNGINSSSTTTSITYLVQNGSYSYTIQPVPGYNTNSTDGTRIVNGENLTVPVKWEMTAYVVRFVETGLSGDNWTVILDGNSSTTTSSVLTYTEPNGTYAYTILPPAGFNANVSAGNVTLNGRDVSIPISFQHVNSTQVTGSPPTSPEPPPTGSQPPPSTSTASPNSGYKELVLELVTFSLAPSIILTLYSAMYLFKEMKPEKEAVRKVHYRKKKVR